MIISPLNAREHPNFGVKIFVDLLGFSIPQRGDEFLYFVYCWDRKE